MSAIMDLFGDNIVGPDGKRVDPESLGGPGKVVGIYFAGFPCHGFTSKLKQFYEKLKDSDKGSNMEFVFVSYDKKLETFEKFYRTDEKSCMPWPALDYTTSGRAIKAKLSDKYKVTRIPSLTLIDGEGNTIRTDGRVKMEEDLEAEKWPWHIRSFAEIMNERPLVRNFGQVSDDEPDMKGKVKGLYFAADWEEDCKEFTPKLWQLYRKLVRREKKNFEIILFSLDKWQSEFDKHTKTTMWPFVPFADPRVKELSELYGVKNADLPVLVILNEEDQVISLNAVERALEDHEGKQFPWFREPLRMMWKKNVRQIPLLAGQLLIVFTGRKNEERIEQAKKSLEATAKKYYKPIEDQELYVCYAFETAARDDFVLLLREYLDPELEQSRPYDDDWYDELEGKDPPKEDPSLIVVTNYPQHEYHLCESHSITPEVVEKFVDEVMSGKRKAQLIPGWKPE